MWYYQVFNEAIHSISPVVSIYTFDIFNKQSLASSSEQGLLSSGWSVVEKKIILDINQLMTICGNIEEYYIYIYTNNWESARHILRELFSELVFVLIKRILNPK